MQRCPQSLSRALSLTAHTGTGRPRPGTDLPPLHRSHWGTGKPAAHTDGSAPAPASVICGKPHGRRERQLGKGYLCYKSTLLYKMIHRRIPLSNSTPITLKYDAIYQNSNFIQCFENTLLHEEIQSCLNKAPAASLGKSNCRTKAQFYMLVKSAPKPIQRALTQSEWVDSY